MVSKKYLLPLLAVLFVVAFSFSLYWPAITSGLISDDWYLSLPGTNPWNSFLGHWFSGGKGYYYRPLSRLLVYYEARLFGYDGFAQHLISQFLMLATVGVTSAMVWRATGFIGALLTALLLVSSPTVASTTSWVSSQTDLLCAFFMALSIYPIAKNPTHVTYRNMSWSFVFGFLTYLSKDSAAILGPLGLVYLAFLACYPGIKNWRTIKPTVIVGAVNLAFLVLYLGFRVWRLGEISPGSSEAFNPVHGKIWHHSQAYLTGLRELIIPFTDLYRPIDAKEIYACGSLWPAFLTALLFCVLVTLRKAIAAFVLLAFVVAYLPLITARLDLNPSSGMPDLRRYAYIPIFFLAAFAGLLISRKDEKSQDALSPLVACIVIFAFLQASVAQQRIVDYSKAGQFRDKLIHEQSIATSFGNVPVTFYVSALPDKFGDAYVFRNGIESMTSILFPSSRVIDIRGGKDELAASGNGLAYSINMDNNNIPIVKPMEDIWKLRKQIRASGKTAEPMVFDPQNKVNTLTGLAPTGIQITPEPDGIMLSILDSDPVLVLPQFKSDPYYVYSNLVLKLDFVDAKQPYQSDVMQFLWALESENNPSTFPYIDTTVEIRPGEQTVTFNLEQNARWFRQGSLKFARIDFPEGYKGRVKVTYIGLK